MKESLSCINNKCIFRETFNSFDAIEKNGGTPIGGLVGTTSPNIVNGVLVCDENLYDRVQYGNIDKFKLTTTFTVRIIFKPYDGQTASNQYFISKYTGTGNQRSWAGYINTSGKVIITSSNDGTSGALFTCTTDNVIFDNGAATDFTELVLVFAPGGGKIYINGSVVPTTGTISATIFDSTAELEIMTSISGECDIAEIYEGELIANEVSLLYKNTLNKDVKDSGLTPLLKYDFVKNQTNYDEAGNATAPTDTNVTYLKQGALFNGTDSIIDTNLAHADLDLTGDITFEAVINPIAFGANGGRILDNSKLIFSINLNALVFSSNGTTFILSTNGSILINDKPNHCIITRNTAGNKTNIYVDGILSGDADRNSGTPLAGTEDIAIGNNIAGDRTFDGIIKNVNVFQGLMTAEQIAQRYQYWKNRGYLQ